MNSTAIRRLKWTELACRDPTSMTLAVDAKTSEFPEEHDFYHLVDAKGYMSYQKLGRERLGCRQDADTLIDLARRDEWQAATPPVLYTVRANECGAARSGRARGHGNGGRGWRDGREATQGARVADADVAVPAAAGNANAGRSRGYRRGRGVERGFRT